MWICIFIVRVQKGCMKEELTGLWGYECKCKGKNVGAYQISLRLSKVVNWMEVCVGFNIALSIGLLYLGD